MTDKIRAALEKHLVALTPAIATAYENASYKPVNGTPYQMAFVRYADPDNRVLGCARRYELGFLQVTLCYPIDKGASAVEDRANLLREHFKRGTVLTHSGQNLQVINTPSKKVLGSDGAVFKMAISINFRAEVFG